MMRLHVLLCFIIWFSSCWSKLLAVDKVLSTDVRTVAAKADRNVLDIWTFPGLHSQPYRLFTNVELRLNLSNQEQENSDRSVHFQLYRSDNRSEVVHEFEESRRFFGFFRKFDIWRSSQIPPFHKTFIGIETVEPYQIQVKITNVDYVRLIASLGGLLLFFFGGVLARNAIFYYSTGAGIGVMASLLIVVFVLYRMLPKKSMASAVLLGGWSFSLYVVYCIWQNMYSILLDYQKLVAGYLVTVVLISLAVCYWRGPLIDTRTQNLFQWFLQLVGLSTIYGCCQIREISLATILSLICIYNFPTSLISRLDKLRYRLFPSKRRLLTEEEYLQQGHTETKKALEELRSFCRSPDCDAWKVISRLETPISLSEVADRMSYRRFTEFVNGRSHLSDAELLHYDTELFNSDPRDSDGSEYSDRSNESLGAGHDEPIEAGNLHTHNGNLHTMSERPQREYMSPGRARLQQELETRRMYRSFTDTPPGNFRRRVAHSASTSSAGSRRRTKETASTNKMPPRKYAQRFVKSPKDQEPPPAEISSDDD